METIVAAAVRIPLPKSLLTELGYSDGDPDHLVLSAPRPARHHHLLHMFFLRFGQSPGAAINQGFVTSTGRFVSRTEAHAIAVASGQPMIDHPSRIAGVLFSEDLW